MFIDLLEFGQAEATLVSSLIFFVLLTGLADMVGLNITVLAEHFRTIITPNPVLGHVLGSFSRQDISIFILLFIVWLACLYSHLVAARTLYEIEHTLERCTLYLLKHAWEDLTDHPSIHLISTLPAV